MPALDAAPLEKRQYGYYTCYSGGYAYRCSNSAWNSWGRWVLFAAIVGGAILIFLLFACISARRRRKAGAKPYMGTAWAAGRVPQGHAPAQYNMQQPYYNNNSNAQPYYNNNSNAPPSYQPGANSDYYGANNGVPLQQPQPAYGQGFNRAAETNYDPPKEPPPQNRY